MRFLRNKKKKITISFLRKLIFMWKTRCICVDLAADRLIHFTLSFI